MHHDEKRLCQTGITTTLQKMSASTTKKVSQHEFQSGLLNMLLEDMQPIAIVERSGFQKFCARFLPHVSLPSRRTLTRQVSDAYKTSKQEMIAELQNVKHVSCTADLWSSHNRSFIGMTVHYINPLNVERVSHTLLCRRFENSHTGEVIAKTVAVVLKEFQIVDKMVDIVTDNAAYVSNAAMTIQLWLKHSDYYLTYVTVIQKLRTVM